MKRGGKLSPTSKKRLAELPARKEVREAVFARDKRCVMHGVWDACSGPLTPHHLLKASQGGNYSEDNLVTLCAYHNTKVEDEPHEACRFGLVIRSWEGA